MEFNDQTVKSAKSTLKTPVELADYYAKRTDLMVKMKSFSEVYAAKEIEADIKWTIERMKGEESPTNLAKILENIVADFGNKWFDENVKFVQLSPFDDRKAKGDVVMEIKNNSRVVRILIDLTTGENSQGTNDKMYNNEEEVRKGKLTDVKYFISKMDGAKGKLTNVPRVVAGAGEKTIAEFLELMANGYPAEREKTIPAMLLEQIADQLIWLYNLAQKNSSGRRAEEAFRDAIEAIQKVLEKNKSLLTCEYEKKALSDNVYKRLKLH